MNIFENSKEFFGSIGSEVTDETLLSLFQLAKQIQKRLGKQGYLLERYLSIFFDGISSVLAIEAAEQGFIKSNRLQAFFCNLFENSNEKELNPFYERAKELFYNQADKMTYQEQYTKVCLLMVMIADDTMESAVSDFMEATTENLFRMIDEMRMKELYEQISYRVGEAMMEELNLKLKQRFLITPAAMIFAQGINNDLIYRLTMRDDETSKQIFQLFLDDLPEIV